MDAIELQAQKRDKSAVAKHLRWDDFIPGEVYGGGEENVSLQLDYHDFRRAYKVAGENTIIDLKIGENSTPRKVLVHEVQFSPVSGKIQHVDFVNVRMDKEVYTHIPLEFVGTSPAVKDLGGMLITTLNELEVKCLPTHLVHSIEVDISGIEDFHTSIHVKDIKVPEGLTVLNEPDLMVVNVAPPREEEVETAAPTAEEAGAEPAAGESPAEGAAPEAEKKE